MTRSDEMFAAGSGVVHPVQCLTRGDVAFFATGTPLRDTRGEQPHKVEVRFKGHKGDQDQVGSVRVRTRSEVRGPRSSSTADGGAVAPMLELMSCFPGLPDHAPLSSCRCGKALRVIRCGRALRAIKEVVAESGRNPDEFAYTRCVSEVRPRSRRGNTYRNELSRERGGGGPTRTRCTRAIT